MRPAGEALAEHLAQLEADGLTPPLAETGVLLGGDLYADPSARQRGATGDVRDVWRAFAAGFRWVAGVGGNHDLFGSTPRERERFRGEPGVLLLDGDVVEADGLRIGGVSGIAGDPSRPGRREEAAILEALGRVIAAQPDVIVLHEGPACGRGYPGSEAAADLLRACGDLLVVCGHVHWPAPLASLSERVQVVNVTERALLLGPAR